MLALPTLLLRPSPPAVRACGLIKSFGGGMPGVGGGVVALAGVNFEVRRGELVGLVGPRGAGKTTLLQCLCGLLKSDGGSLHVFGEPFGGGLCVPGASYVPPEPAFHPFLTVRDVLEMRAARNVSGPRAGDFVDRLLRDFELGSTAANRVSALPKHILSRLAIAEALAGDPTLLLIDSGNGPDLAPGTMTMAALGTAAHSGVSIVIAAREASTLIPAADRIALMQNGRIARTFALDSLGELFVPGVPVPVRTRRVADRMH